MLIARSAPNKDMIVASQQPEIDKVVAWTAKAKLTLNSSKCETVVYILDCEEALCRPNITIDGKRVFCSPIPIFLDVKYDRKHACQIMYESSANLCPAALTSSWLCEARPGNGTLRSVVRSTSQLCVACSNMQPGHHGYQLPPLSLRVLLVAARAITGLVRTTPVEAVLVEYQLPHISTRFQNNLVKTQIHHRLLQGIVSMANSD